MNKLIGWLVVGSLVIATLFVIQDELDSVSTEEATQAIELGMNCAQSGVPADANPYTKEALRAKWLKGWSDAKISTQLYNPQPD